MRVKGQRTVAVLFAAAVLIGGGATAMPTPATAATADIRHKIVSTAEGELGQGERPPGSNCTRYSPVCEEWCADFATWVWRRAGITIGRIAAVSEVFRWGRQHGRAHNGHRGMKPGDLVIYGGNKHIGIVATVHAGGTIETIEGNSSNRVVRQRAFDPAHARAAGRPGDITGYVSAS
ncbi:CHAP domain-containing protein [Amycolatopsis jejuensis]|uniref:C40 family peptidase n=1 Tax=Amycolatopsis jejuensis TaxID=330084 RepID=UPI00068B3259|nr:CHAP domain-containing protein [Amycolatopsis jejuensis]